jgi:hypothetical protein
MFNSIFNYAGSPLLGSYRSRLDADRNPALYRPAPAGHAYARLVGG